MIYLLIIPALIFALLLWLVFKNADSFESDLNVDGYNGYVDDSEYDDNLD